MSVFRTSLVLAGRSAVAAALAFAAAAAEPPADLVLTGAKLYTVDASHSVAAALAVQNERVVFVGSDADVKRWIGPHTKLESLGGRLVLPGLVDAHMHPLDIVDLDVCDLDSRPLSLRDLSAFVAKCLDRYKTPPGQRLVVHQWSYTAGNQPDARHPTLRAALDAVSTQVQIQLLGNDGHHGAFNSLGLAQARSARGQVVGLSKATLASMAPESQTAPSTRTLATSSTSTACCIRTWRKWRRSPNVFRSG
jgi:predicted amidohydrolase YtcJ